MPLVLDPIQSGYNLSKINDNFQRIEDTWDEKLDRVNSGSFYNQMDQTLDMNSNEIINVKVGDTDDSLVTKGYVDQQDELRVLKVGDSMTGQLNTIDPVDLGNATNKRYVDGMIASIDGVDGIVPLISPRQQGDGVTVVFPTIITSQHPTQSYSVNLDGVTQRPQTDYTADTNGNVVFAEAPEVGVDIDITVFEPVNLQEAADLSQVTSTGSTTPRTLADRFAEVTNVLDFGAVGDGVVDDTQSILDAIAESTSTVFLPKGNYRVTSEIVIDKPINFVGSGMTINTATGTRITFEGGNGLTVTGGTYAGSVTDLNLYGSTTGIGLNINPEVNLAGVTNHNYKNLRIERFATGLQTFYTWTNTFDNIRINGCDQGFLMGAQTNSSAFLNFSATNCTQHSRFVNVEGLHFDCANISNQTGTYAFSLAQSYVTMNSPYFENVPDNFVLLGASSEVNPSTLVINGGIINNNVLIGGQNCQLFINGSRTSGGGTKIDGVSTVPVVMPANLYVKFADLGSGSSTLRKDANLDVYFDKPKFFNNASGGGVRFIDYYPTYYTFEQQAVNNGINLSNDLVVGDQYTLVMQVRRDFVTNPSLRMGAANISFDDNAIPSVNDDWALVTIPFVATDPKLDMLYQGTLQIKKLGIYEGIVNSNVFDLPEPHSFFLDKQPTTSGWEDGTVVFNNKPIVGEALGWTFNGTWLAMPNYS